MFGPPVSCFSDCWSLHLWSLFGFWERAFASAASGYGFDVKKPICNSSLKENLWFLLVLMILLSGWMLDAGWWMADWLTTLGRLGEKEVSLSALLLHKPIRWWTRIARILTFLTTDFGYCVECNMGFEKAKIETNTKRGPNWGRDFSRLTGKNSLSTAGEGTNAPLNGFSPCSIGLFLFPSQLMDSWRKRKRNWTMQVAK